MTGCRAALLAGLLMAGCSPGAEPSEATRLRTGDAEAGRVIIREVGCVACHAIPGVAGPKGQVGPSLDGFGDQALIAGVLPNRPDLLIAFVRNAPAFDPQIGMPPMPLTERQARDVAAYLYTLDDD